MIHCAKCSDGLISLVFIHNDGKPDSARTRPVLCNCIPLRSHPFAAMGSALTHVEAMEKVNLNPQRYRILDNETADSFGFFKGE